MKCEVGWQSFHVQGRSGTTVVHDALVIGDWCLHEGDLKLVGIDGATKEEVSGGLHLSHFSSGMAVPVPRLQRTFPILCRLLVELGCKVGGSWSRDEVLANDSKIQEWKARASAVVASCLQDVEEDRQRSNQAWLAEALARGLETR